MDKVILFNNKEDCCNCGACENICSKKAISMIADSDGFMFPEINHDLCIGCRQCIKVCPMRKHREQKLAESRRKHIKIVNFGNENNFGAVIAAVCLENTVRNTVSENVNVRSVNYKRFASVPTRKDKIKKALYEWLELIRIILIKLHVLKKSQSAEPAKKKHPASSLKKHRYNRFRALFLDSTPQMDDIDLGENNDNNAALICGSDVIWHPNILASGTAKAFYLNFGGKNTRRIAYAPSVDFKDGKELRKYRKLYKKELKRFDFISVRERESVNFIQSITKKKVQQCCDPVFLYRPEEFDEMISTSEETVPDGEYIYAYILRKNDYAVEYVRKLAKEKNLKICFYAEEYDDFGEDAVNCFSDGPAEFLQRVKNAKYIITTSFHCVAFSLIFKKQFLSFTRSETGNKIPDVLETFGVSDRQVDNGVIKDIDEPIDFDAVENRINALRQQSLDYLRNALKDI